MLWFCESQFLPSQPAFCCQVDPFLVFLSVGCVVFFVSGFWKRLLATSYASSFSAKRKLLLSALSRFGWNDSALGVALSNCCFTFFSSFQSEVKRSQTSSSDFAWSAFNLAIVLERSTHLRETFRLFFSNMRVTFCCSDPAMAILFSLWDWVICVSVWGSMFFGSVSQAVETVLAKNGLKMDWDEDGTL